MADLKDSMILEPDDTTETLPSVQDALTLRAVLTAIIIGTAVCFANMYFGLVGGYGNAMPMQSALIGFALFSSVRHHLAKRLTPAETTIIEVVGSTLGLAPFPAGLTSIIPALEHLTGSIQFSFFQTLAWACATCALGIVVAPAFRRMFLLRRGLRFPSATATGTLIGVLFGSTTAIRRAHRSEQHTANVQYLKGDAEVVVSTVDCDAADDVGKASLAEDASALDPKGTDHAIRLLLASLAASLSFSFILYTKPSLRNVPLFGFAAQAWLWSFDLSPAYFGFGMIIGPQVHAWMLLGTVIGWGILSPLAMHMGWTHGAVDGWEHGTRGWLLWVSMGLVLGDTMVGVCWVMLKFLFDSAGAVIINRSRKRVYKHAAQEYDPLLPRRQIGSQAGPSSNSAEEDDDEWSLESLVTTRLLLWSSAVLVSIYLFTTMGVFHGWLPSWPAMLSLILIPLAGFISMQTFGETENTGSLAIGRAVQLIMGFAIPSTFPHHLAANLMLTGVVESGSAAPAQHMAELKIAYLTQTPPRAVFYGQLIGAFVGAGISTVVYRIYTSVRTIPSAEFSIPDSHMYLVAADLIYEKGLPPGVLSFMVAAFVVGAVFGVLRIMGTGRSWQRFVPSGMAMALGMYIVPAITLPRVVGSMILLVCRDAFAVPSFVLICSATGLILGQGIFSVFGLVLDAVRM